MEIILTRKQRTPNSTIGQLSINGNSKAYCYILEDTDRGLLSTMDLKTIAALKVKGKTAIPSGRYQVINTLSNRFKRYLPELVNVPGYAGVRIHPGNSAIDTEGCLLPGMVTSPDFVGRSKEAFNLIYPLITKALITEKVYITIK